jgi:ATP-binding cassette subfamily B protein
MSELAALTWPLSRLGEALEALGRQSGLSPSPIQTPSPPEAFALAGNEDDELDDWLEAVASQMRLEVEPAEAPYAEADRLVRTAGPALLRVPGGGDPRFLCVLGGGRRVVSLLGPDRVVHRVRLEVVRTALCRNFEAPLASEVDRLLDEAEVPLGRRTRARAAILRQRLSAARLRGCWLLRLPPGARFWDQLSHARQPRRLLGLVGAHALQYLLWILSWWMVGRAALAGRFDRGWLTAWALILLTLVPFQLLVTWLQGAIAIGTGALLKRRLLAGALQLEPEEIRHQGAGQLLGCVIESETMESLALSGGFLGLVAGIELVAAAVILVLGAGGWLQALLLAAWVALAFLLGGRYLRDRDRWTDSRLEMTHDLVERMVGHRTRLAQEGREHWHDAEDRALQRYLDVSAAMDRTATLVMALLPRGWLLLALLGLVPAFVSGRGSPTALAIALGGTILAYRALRRLTAGLAHLAGAAIAWRRVAPLFHAAARQPAHGVPTVALSSQTHTDPGEDAWVLEADNLLFRYRDRGEPVLRECTLRIRTGDRMLLEGRSGSGKSTLVSLLSGLRVPQSGLLLLRGLDRQSLGDSGWRRRVAVAPQFHENHVLAETFAFNLLMGRRWPAPPHDLQETEAVCRGLGLGDLLDRMPAGLLQMVGETGWQLSHGERSRVYIARALLQRPDLVLLDESFAALDPENLRRALSYILERAHTVLVVAHP